LSSATPSNSAPADRDFSKLDKPIQRRVFRYLHERIANAQDARDFGKPLQHHLAALWRYRVGDFRILCQIEDERLTVLVVEIAYRGVAYDEPQKHLPRPKPLVEILRFA
jgi:mRNA interferase RelE/StbE